MRGSLFRSRRVRRGFLRGVALDGLYLRVKLADSIGFVVGRNRFLPFDKRAFPEIHGAVLLPHLGVDVAKVREDRGIVHLVLDGFAKIFFGFGELVLFVVSPAERIEIGAVVGVLLHGALNHRRSFIQAQAAVGEHVAVIIQNGGIGWIRGQRFFEFAFGLIPLLLALVDDAEHEPGGFLRSTVFRQPERFLRILLGFGIFLAALEDLREV